MGKYITISAACNSYNVTRKTIYNWREKGLIKEKRQGRSVLLDTDSIELMITRKLPNLITQSDTSLLEEISKLHQKIDNLEKLVTQLLPQKTGNVTQKQEKASPTAANEKRKEEAISKARNKYIELGMPAISRAELAGQAGVDRNTVGKHWEIITHKGTQ